jgi:restriction system protein
MNYYEAALKVLEAAEHPLSAKEITDRALTAGLITTHGKTPERTMSAALYGQLGTDSSLVKDATAGSVRAKRGTVRWTLKKARAN